ncbi:hypothetical protein Droror1_Dr00018643 [Drosera rotundifolia]
MAATAATTTTTAAIFGTISLFSDSSLPRASISGQKPRFESSHKSDFSFQSSRFKFDGARRRNWSAVRGKEKAVDFFGDEENEEGDEEYDEFFVWEKEMRKRVKELEERKELEEKAEELRVKVEEESRELGIEETEEEKSLRVRKELEKVAKEQAERRATAKLMFDLGQKAYEKGIYGRSVEYFEAALTIIPRLSMFGGEIQIWLAMAYDANNRHADCIDLYKQSEDKHPSISIQRQAADLRYIMESPKIKVNQEDMLTMPSIGSAYDKYATTWTDKGKDSDPRDYLGGGSTGSPLPSSRRDYLGDLLRWKPAVGVEKTRIFWAAVTLWLVLVGAAIIQQR